MLKRSFTLMALLKWFALIFSCDIFYIIDKLILKGCRLFTQACPTTPGTCVTPKVQLCPQTRWMGSVCNSLTSKVSHIVYWSQTTNTNTNCFNQRFCSTVKIMIYQFSLFENKLELLLKYQKQHLCKWWLERQQSLDLFEILQILLQ